MMNKVTVNREKPSFLKRTVAYLIDMIMVTLLASAITLVFVDNTKYKAESQELMELTKKFTSNEITKEEYTEQFDSLNYIMTKDNIEVTIISISVSLVYYVVLCYFCHGITLGKYLMKLQITSANGKKLNMGHYLIRALLINMILSNILSVVLVSCLDKSGFIAVYPKVSNALTIVLLATIIFIMYREDGRGLHDLISNTKIISTKKVTYNVEVEKEEVKKETEEEKTTKKEVVDASVIEEKEVKKNSTKKKGTTKKSTKKTGGKK